MAESYNPIVRTFARFRAGLLRSLDVPRNAIRPWMDLETLIPIARRREVWRSLRREGLRVPALELAPLESKLHTALVLKSVVSFFLWMQHWSAWLLALPLGALEYWWSRPRAVHFPLGLKTVGDMVLYLTSFREHKKSGYRWTHNEIAFKVRLIVAEALAVPLDAVQPEKTLEELGAC
jgi:hypothetical protein